MPPGRQASSMVARGRPSTASAGRPSPIWASMLSDPIRPLVSLTQAYWSSLVSRAPPMTAKPSGPLRSRPSRTAVVTRRSASFQVAGFSEQPRIAQERAAEAVLAVHGLEVEAALVAQPAPVDRVVVDALVAQHPVAARLHHDPAADRARGARRLDLLEVPRPGLEAVRRGGQRAHRADLHGVAAEVAGERVVGERVDLRLVAPVHEVDERVARHLLGEPGAAVAEDAALAVEQHHVADRDRLLEVPLLLDEAALAGPVGHRLVLQRALAALVAHRAVERVVHEEELEHPLLRLLGDRRVGRHGHPVGALDHAGRLEGGAAAGVDLDDAHAAHAHRLHPRVVAEARDVDAAALGGVDDQLALGGLDGLAVDGDADRGRRGGVGHEGSPTETVGGVDR